MVITFELLEVDDPDILVRYSLGSGGKKIKAMIVFRKVKLQEINMVINLLQQKGFNANPQND